MTEPKGNERFIPIRKQELIDDLLAAEHWQAEQRQYFQDFCRLWIALYHYKFHAHLEQLKCCYFPFNPDTNLVTRHQYTAEELNTLYQQLVQSMQQLLNHANYEALTKAEIQEALNAISHYGLNVSVDLDDFAEMAIYYRGATVETRWKRSWKTLFLVKEAIEIPIYRRFLLLVKFKTEAERIQELKVQNPQLSTKQAHRKVKKARRGLPQALVQQDRVLLKLFKNIPRADLGMLFPNQKVRLKWVDKVKLAITGGSGTIGGLSAVVGKLSVAVLNPLALASAFAGLVGIIVRQVMNIFNQRNKYMMVLAKNLYFHSLYNNLGVISRLIDVAEEEECKEAILAYYFLYVHQDQEYTQEDLDRVIEDYIQQRYGISINFEVEDGIAKLAQEGLLSCSEQGILKIIDLPQACQQLDAQWDGLFRFEPVK